MPHPWLFFTDFFKVGPETWFENTSHRGSIEDGLDNLIISPDLNIVFANLQKIPQQEGTLLKILIQLPFRLIFPHAGCCVGNDSGQSEDDADDNAECHQDQLGLDGLRC